jgi:hypothetical protein
LGRFWRALDWKKGYISWPFGVVWQLGYFITIWYILYSSGAFFPVLVSRTRKNLATLRWKWKLEAICFGKNFLNWLHSYETLCRSLRMYGARIILYQNLLMFMELCSVKPIDTYPCFLL